VHDYDMIKRVEYALAKMQSGGLEPSAFAAYCHQVLSSYLGVGKSDLEPDDLSLASTPGELGEAPKGWEVGEDFTDRDVAEMEAGDEFDAPDDHKID